MESPNRGGGGGLCKENKEPRESRASVKNFVPLSQGLLFQPPWGTFLSPASRLKASLAPGEGTRKEAFLSSCVPKLHSLFHFLQRHLPSLGSTQWLSNLFPRLKNWRRAP